MLIQLLIWLHGLLDELGFPQMTSAHSSHADNQPTIRLLTNKGASAGRTKHLRRRFNGLREHVMNGEDISVHSLASDLMIADIRLTKPLLTRSDSSFPKPSTPFINGFVLPPRPPGAF